MQYFSWHEMYKVKCWVHYCECPPFVRDVLSMLSEVHINFHTEVDEKYSMDTMY